MSYKQIVINKLINNNGEKLEKIDEGEEAILIGNTLSVLVTKKNGEIEIEEIIDKKRVFLVD